MHGRLITMSLGCLALAACGSPDRSAPAPRTPTAAATVQQHAPRAQRLHRFHSARLGFYIDYPASMDSSVRFDSHYLANDAWKAYAPPQSKGAAVLMLTLPGSNDVTAGELRIGVSSTARAIAQCRQPPASVQPSTRATATINGIGFTTWHAADAAMSHYLKVHSYRTVHGKYCYAIDLMVIGTNPEVYSPPKTPPFTSNEAFTALEQALHGFHFTR